MRVGDFGVEVVAVEDGEVREVDSGHVLARQGTVYSLRLRNLGPLRCVADVHIDGKVVTGGGLVLDPYSVTNLERPVHEREAGRFTVIAEGDERVFGPDGGRDNPDLGMIEVRFRRELPREQRADARPLPDEPRLPLPIVPATSPQMPPTPGRPMAPPEWTPPGWNNERQSSRYTRSSFEARLARAQPEAPPAAPADLIERAAGTGLTGHSSQRFIPVSVGPLETEATVIRLRIVIGSDEAFATPRVLPETQDAPARPAARP